MKEGMSYPDARFVNMVHVDEVYHEQHSHYLHSHRSILELLYILEGQGFYYVNKREYIVNAGNLVICNAGVTHGESPLRRNKMRSMCCVLKNVQMDNLPENVICDVKQNPVLYFPGGEAEHLMKAMDSIFKQLGRESKPVFDKVPNVLLEIICHRLARREQQISWSQDNQGEFIGEIMTYLDKNYAENLTLEDISERFHISQSAFSRFFKETVGISPIQYILCRRIGEAQSMLVNTNKSLNEIGSSVGYYDSCHFSSAFKRHTGLTPSQYRKNFPKNRYMESNDVE